MVEYTFNAREGYSYDPDTLVHCDKPTSTIVAYATTDGQRGWNYLCAEHLEQVKKARPKLYRGLIVAEISEELQDAQPDDRPKFPSLSS